MSTEKSRKEFNAATERMLKGRGRTQSMKWSGRVDGCVLCGATALRRVGTKGYCKAHYADAQTQNRKIAGNRGRRARLAGTAAWPE